MDASAPEHHDAGGPRVLSPDRRHQPSAADYRRIVVTNTLLQVGSNAVIVRMRPIPSRYRDRRRQRPVAYQWVFGDARTPIP